MKFNWGSTHKNRNLTFGIMGCFNHETRHALRNSVLELKLRLKTKDNSGLRRVLNINDCFNTQHKYCTYCRHLKVAKP